MTAIPTSSRLSVCAFFFLLGRDAERALPIGDRGRRSVRYFVRLLDTQVGKRVAACSTPDALARVTDEAAAVVLQALGAIGLIFLNELAAGTTTGAVEESLRRSTANQNLAMSMKLAEPALGLWLEAAHTFEGAIRLVLRKPDDVPERFLKPYVRFFCAMVGLHSSTVREPVLLAEYAREQARALRGTLQSNRREIRPFGEAVADHDDEAFARAAFTAWFPKILDADETHTPR